MSQHMLTSMTIKKEDRLAKAAKNRDHKVVPRTEQELNDPDIDKLRMADAIVVAYCNAQASHAYVDSRLGLVHLIERS